MVDEPRKLVIAAFASVKRTERRMWSARDEVTRLRRQLVDAEQQAAAAEREHDEARTLLEEAWSLMRSDLTHAAEASV